MNEVLQKIEALEKRVAALEARFSDSKPSSGIGVKERLYADVTCFKRDGDGNIIFDYSHSDEKVIKDIYNELLAKNLQDLLKSATWDCWTPYQTGLRKRFSYAVLTDGTLRSLCYIGDTLREVKMVADLCGISYEKGVKKEKLTSEIIKVYNGVNGTAIAEGYLVYAAGIVNKVSDVNLNSIKDFYNSTDFRREFIAEDVDITSGMTEAQIVKAYVDAMNGAKRRYEYSGEKEAERYLKENEIYQSKKKK